MNASERPRATYTHTYIHRKVHGALFVQTINDVAQGHHAQFARISIVIIIIMIERLFEKREREKKGCSSCTRSCYVFALLRERTRTHSCTGTKHRNSNDVASFSVPHAPLHHRLVCGEVVVVVVVIVMLVV
jgi:hypothetical protein